MNRPTPAFTEQWKGANPESPGRWSQLDVTASLLGGVPGEIPAEWAHTCAARLRTLRDRLREDWVGLTHAARDPGDDPRAGLTDWLLAGMIARENVLLIGGPGTAKTEIATRTFQLLGLTEPAADEEALGEAMEKADSPRQWWVKREQREREKYKYFHYLLSRFTQPEELFGPIEISLLRQGYHVRVNFGLLTGAGVRAAFLDEVFKASSSILNTLLSLTNERRYPNWGAQQESDLLMFVGASNEMPGGYSGGADGTGGDEFATLYAFLDRFPIRLAVPQLSAGNDAPEKSLLARAFDKAVEREGQRFCTGRPFAGTSDMPSINDALLLGRFAFQHLANDGWATPFKDNARAFRQAFLRVAAALQSQGTILPRRVIRWTLSPRKLKALYKIALAHALIRTGFVSNGSVVAAGRPDLHVFDLIWDAAAERDNLRERVASLIQHVEAM
jgi:hypothetical protein